MASVHSFVPVMSNLGATLLAEAAPAWDLSSPRGADDLATKHVSRTVCVWFESWRPWQQRMLVCGLTDRCSVSQLATLSTTLEPVFHRDFVANVRQRYPSAPFRHMKKRVIEKERLAEERRKAHAFRDTFYESYPTIVPRVAESDFPVLNDLLQHDLSADSNNRLLSTFAGQLSARLIVNAYHVLRDEPQIVADSNVAQKKISTGPVRQIPVIRIVSDHIDVESPVQTTSRTDELPTPMTAARCDSSDDAVTDDLNPQLSAINEDGIVGDTPRLKASIAEESSSLSNCSEQGCESTNKDELMKDPLSSTCKQKKSSEVIRILDIPPLRVLSEHRHKSAISTASEVGTVDFFLSTNTSKLGCMQRGLRTNCSGRPRGVQQDILLPIQKSYKPARFCSADDSGMVYERAHRGKLRSQFRGQLRQVWTWMDQWRDYERMVLLSDITKLCDAAVIEYLCECLSVRIRDRIDIESLQDNVLMKIFAYLPHTDLDNASQVCKRWRYLCSLDELWMQKCKKMGYLHGLTNINNIIINTRRESEQIDWKLAYHEILRISEKSKNAKQKPVQVRYHEATPDGTRRVDRKLDPIFNSRYGSRVNDIKSVPKQSAPLHAKRVSICRLRSQGEVVVNDDDDDDDAEIILHNEYFVHRESGDRNATPRRRTLKTPSYEWSLDVTSLARHGRGEQPADNAVAEGARTVSEMRRKKKRYEEETALDVRPDLKQARDLLSQSVARRTLMWRHGKKSEMKNKAKFAGEVKSVHRVRKLQGHLDAVLCIAISRRRMLSGSMDRSIRIWHLNSGSCIHKLYGHLGGVRCLYFEGDMLVSGSWDMQVMVWDLIKFDRRAVLSGHRGSVSAVAFNERYLVSASHDRTVRVYFTYTFMLHKVITGHSQAITCMKMDGDRVLTGSTDKTIRYSSLDTGACLRTFTLLDPVVCMCFSNDLIIIGNNRGHCYFANKQSGALEAGIEAHNGAVNAVLIHGNRFFTASSDSIVKEWDLVTMTCVRSLQGPRGPVRDLCADGKRIISCGDDGNIRMWDLCAPEGERLSTQSDVIPCAVVWKT